MMKSKINPTRKADVSEIVSNAVNKPLDGGQLTVLTSPLLLNELCDVIFPGLGFPNR